MANVEGNRSQGGGLVSVGFPLDAATLGRIRDLAELFARRYEADGFGRLGRWDLDLVRTFLAYYFGGKLDKDCEQTR